MSDDLKEMKSLKHGISRQRRAGSPRTMVKELIAELQKFDPDAEVQFETGDGYSNEPRRVKLDGQTVVIS